MTYALTIELSAPTLTAAAAAAWDILQGRAGIHYTIKALPPPEAHRAAGCETEEKANGEAQKKARGARRWKPDELRNIADGIVPANLRYDMDFVREVREAVRGNA